MAKTKAEPRFYKVPPGTKPTKCNGSTCGREFFWIRDEQGRPKPIDCDVPGGKRPSIAKDDGGGQQDMFGAKVEVYEGWGQLHHTVCPNVGEFARGGREELPFR